MTKILFFIAEDWSFLSHRRPLAEGCRDAGWEVVVAARATDRVDTIRALGVTFEPVPIERGGMNPLRDLRTLAAMIGVARRHRPAIVHTVGLKPVLYGNLAAMLAGTPHVVSALAGMGTLLSGAISRLELLRAAVLAALRVTLRRRRTRVIVQNDDDRALVLVNRLTRSEQIVTIRGSGVDLNAFPALPEPPASPPGMPVVFALVARMLADKGVPEAVDAIRLLRARGVAARLRLVGAPDPQNPMTLSETQLRAWAVEDGIEWLGHQDDIAAVWRAAHVALLPSWREGMPKALLEALACARPVITTDAPGCRDVIADGVEGILVPVRDAAALAVAMEKLVADAPLRHRMGVAARRRAEARFDQRLVVAAHLDLYRAMLGGPGSGTARR